MKCRTAGCGYFNRIDGEGWPDYVMVENDGDVFKGTYDAREYYPVNIRALLALAEEMERIADVAAGHTAYADRFDFAGFAHRIREALGVSE